MPGGRPGQGPELVEGLAGTPEAKRRLKLVLETLAGERSVAEACRELGLGEANFHKLRRQALAAALARLAGLLPGRKRVEPSAQEQEIAALRAQLQRKDLALEIARYRENLALTMPYLLKRRAAEEEAKKKGGRGGGGK